MRHDVDRLSPTLLIAALLVSLPLAGCNKLTPAGSNPTMALLRDGSEKVCIASDVQKALRDLIVPKAAELQSNVPMETRVSAAAGVSLSYDLTTLQSFDKDVSKASCHTTATMHGASSDKSNKFSLDYQVSPSADNPGAFVVTATVDDTRAFANDLIGEAINDVAAKAVEEDRTRQEALSKQQLLSTISEKWLLGAWIDSGGATSSCGNGQAIWFESAHVLEGGLGKGRWSLAQDQLHLVGGDDKPFDTTVTITAADPISFTMTFPDGTANALRRCTRDETEALPQPTSDGSAPQ